MTTRSIRRGAALGLALLLAGPSAATRGDTFRVKTGRGTFLVEVDAPGITVRADGDDLVVSRPPGEEIRVKFDDERAARASSDPAFSILRDGKAILTARRIGAAPPMLLAPAVGSKGERALGGPANGSAWGLAITPDGKTLATGHQGFIRVWDLATLAERFNVPTGKTVRRVALTPDGASLASAEYQHEAGKAVGNLVLRDGKTGEALRVSDPVEAVHGVAIDPSGKVVVSSSWAEKDIRVWDAETGKQVGTLKGHSGVVGTIAYSPDGKTLASAGDNTVRLWDVDTGEVRKILRGHGKSVESVAFSADGKTVGSGGFDATARAWDAATGKLLATFEADEPVLAVAVSPDGKAVAAASARWGNGFYGRAPAEVRVWDVASSKPLATLPEQPNQVFGVVFTPDGKSLITASLSGALTVYDLAQFPPEKAAPPPGR